MLIRLLVLFLVTACGEEESIKGNGVDAAPPDAMVDERQCGVLFPIDDSRVKSSFRDEIVVETVHDLFLTDNDFVAVSFAYGAHFAKGALTPGAYPANHPDIRIEVLDGPDSDGRLKAKSGKVTVLPSQDVILQDLVLVQWDADNSRFVEDGCRGQIALLTLKAPSR